MTYLNESGYSASYAYVRRNIALSAFRRVISINIADACARYYGDGAFFMEVPRCDIPPNERIGRGVFWESNVRKNPPLTLPLYDKRRLALLVAPRY